MRAGAIGCLAATMFASSLLGDSTPQPAGSEFQVNSYTPGAQVEPDVAFSSTERFLVIWTSWDPGSGDPTTQNVMARSFSAQGSPHLPDFQVHAQTTGVESSGRVAATDTGGFVVVWSESSSPTDGRANGRLLDGLGAPITAAFQLNSTTSGVHGLWMDVATTDDGGFVAAWTSYGTPGDPSAGSVRARRFSENSTPSGPDFQLNTYLPSTQRMPSVAARGQSGFVVGWNSYGSSGGDNDSGSVQVRRFSGIGPQGPEIQVNEYVTGTQPFPVVASRSDGSFVVVWQSQGSSGTDQSGTSVLARNFDPSGASVGSEVQIASHTTGSQGTPHVEMDSDGDFVAVWESDGSPGTDSFGLSIQGRRFSASGDPLGSQFQLNTYTTGNQQGPRVAFDDVGDFVAVWSSQGSSGDDDSERSVQARRFRVSGELDGRAFRDLDADGLQDAGEPGIPGIVVELYDATAILRRSAVTDGSGSYLLRAKEGSWRLRFLAEAGGSAFTLRDVGADDGADSDVDRSTGQTDPFGVAIGDLNDSVDAGFLMALFRDGFESGTTSAWSATAP